MGAARAKSSNGAEAEAEAAGEQGTRGKGVVRVAVVCGGPSEERGISLNSARSLLDHLQAADVEVTTYFLDRSLRAFAIPAAQMYSNTPSDFDFKLASTGGKAFATQQAFVEHLGRSADIVFPALHGKFGEDGGIQGLLEAGGVPFVGTGAAAAARAFDKYEASRAMAEHGLATLPSFLFLGEASRAGLEQWFQEQALCSHSGRVVVKPARAGSSVGVSVALGQQEAAAHALALLHQAIDDRVVVEMFAGGGVEFTAIVLTARAAAWAEAEGGQGLPPPPPPPSPVTLLPTEVELRVVSAAGGGGTARGEEGEEEEEQQRAIFNYRRKYLPTRQVAYHTPPRFPVEVTQAIRDGASQLFSLLGLRDCARIDGWYLPPASPAAAAIVRGSVGRGDARREGEGEAPGDAGGAAIVFSDVNLVSGMEQTSFLFQQAAQVGLSHAGVLRWILASAAARYSIPLSSLPLPPQQQKQKQKQSAHSTMPGGDASGGSEEGGPHVGETRQKVWVLFGGDTSERQVSLMSGTNVWLKLRSWPDTEAEAEAERLRRNLRLAESRRLQL